jgi:hypothetical protein
VSFFGYFLFSVFGGGGADKKLLRLFDDGALVPATIYAIRVELKGDQAQTSYGLDIQTAAGQRRMSVRQQLDQEPQLATLGAEVWVRHLDDLAAIDWTESLKRLGVDRESVSVPTKVLKQPLEGGIEDERIDRSQLNRWKTGTAKILACARKGTNAQLAAGDWNIEVELDALHETRKLTLSDEFVPSYAEHLLSAGASLPVSIDPEDHSRVTVDWPAAAEVAAGSALRG